jgi:hypothetical protein
VIGLTATLVIDLTYGVIDPRIRMGGGKRWMKKLINQSLNLSREKIFDLTKNLKLNP